MSWWLTYAGLFGWSFLAATVLPLASEAALVGVVLSQESLLLPIVVATAGNFLGACTTYGLGVGGARLMRSDGPSPEPSRQTRSRALLGRYGSVALVLSWVPVLGDALVLAAGALRVPFAAFAFWTLLGKAGRYAVVGWAAAAAV